MTLSTYLIPSALILLLISTINSVSYDSARYFLYSFFLLISFILASILVDAPVICNRGLFMSILGLEAIMLINLFTTGFKPGYNYENIIEGVSSNGYTTVLVILVCFYLINLSSWQSKEFVISAIALYLCFFGYGRGSIVTSCLILSAFAINLIFDSLTPILNNRIKLWPILLLFSICMLASLVPLFNIQTTVETYSKIRFDAHSTNIFASLTHDESRVAIVQNYLQNLDLFSTIFGNDSPSLLFHRSFNGNPHNSFLNSHRLFGIFYMLAVITLAARHLNFKFLERITFSRLILVLAILFRSLSEPILFAAPLDILIFITFFNLSSFLSSNSHPYSMYPRFYRK
ncbi:hypothetical protein KBY85_12100 [Cyanobium sp. BA5m-10]|uniref:hypothetical protein n=1 Tax=Cyanobium sp. BA5m-10 TaxID=2823705 RepID=UPI0020CE82EF|nr:hypothetical protein [Cyanobium sp. BA5m-10]MCP9904872.1 hypothetical protein [Cyanobium sp. BA5m-10]